jgi:gamma-glutamyltranspeptidase/glutathione hydrolase
VRLAGVFVAAVLGVAVPGSPTSAASLPATEATDGIVVSSQRHAAEAGIEMFARGGTAIDAAVAVGYAEAVTNPCCGNLGGGGFMVLRLADGREVFLNFREMAPAAAHADMYLAPDGAVIPRLSLDGWLAVGVPGTVAGLDTALTRFGTLPRAVVMAPAIRLARDGFVLSRGDAAIIARQATRLAARPNVARIFLRPDGSSLQPGDRLVQTDLAATLQAIADHGTAAFYHGAIPAKVEAASRAGGGILTEADFAAYHITEAAPLRCAYRGYTILSAPPPSSGGVTLCQLLTILQGYDLRGMGWHAAAAVHVITEAERHAYLDRNTLLGDPAFVRNPIERLLSPDYAAAIRAQITGGATPSAALQPGVPPHEKPETSHFSVLDGAGNAAAVTYTLNGAFGAGVIAGDTGFLLNDQMDDFTSKPGVPNLFGLVQGAANAIAPGKRPLSSMTPTIVLHDGRVAMVLGSPGGPRIITIVLQTLLNMIDYGMTPQQAVDAPRLHHQWLPDAIFAEPFALSADTRKVLEGMGYRIVEQAPWGAAALAATRTSGGGSAGPASSGHDSAVTAGMRPGFLYGANDPRRPAGAALGYPPPVR